MTSDSYEQVVSLVVSDAWSALAAVEDLVLSEAKEMPWQDLDKMDHVVKIRDAAGAGGPAGRGSASASATRLSCGGGG